MQKDREKWNRFYQMFICVWVDDRKTAVCACMHVLHTPCLQQHRPIKQQAG